MMRKLNKKVITIIGIFITGIILSFLYAKVILPPNIDVMAIPAYVVNSEIGEQQALIITSRNNKWGSIKSLEPRIQTNQLQVEKQGAITGEETNQVIYTFLKKGNNAWEEFELIDLEHVEIKPFSEVQLFFVTELFESYGSIDRFLMDFTYIGNRYEADVSSFLIHILDQSRNDEFAQALRNHYLDIGWSNKEYVQIRKY